MSRLKEFTEFNYNMSNYVVIARFNSATDKKLNKLRKSFTDAGYSVPEWHVHITMAAYENIDEKYCTGIGRYNSIKDDSPSIHCTIAEIATDNLQSAMKLVFNSNCFRKAKITALENYTYPMRLIKRFELK